MSNEIGKVRPEVQELIANWREMKDFLAAHPSGITHTLESERPELGQRYWDYLLGIFNSLDELEKFYYGDVKGVGYPGGHW